VTGLDLWVFEQGESTSPFCSDGPGLVGSNCSRVDIKKQQPGKGLLFDKGILILFGLEADSVVRIQPAFWQGFTGWEGQA